MTIAKKYCTVAENMDAGWGWINPDSAELIEDGVCATFDTLYGAILGKRLKCSVFGFNIPSGASLTKVLFGGVVAVEPWVNNKPHCEFALVKERLSEGFSTGLPEHVCSGAEENSFESQYYSQFDFNDDASFWIEVRAVTGAGNSAGVIHLDSVFIEITYEEPILGGGSASFFVPLVFCFCGFSSWLRRRRKRCSVVL